MKLTVVSITSKSGKGRPGSIDAVADDYIARATRYTPTTAQTFVSEAAFVENLARAVGRVPPKLILCDSTGDPFTSMQFAAHIAQHRDTGTQHLILAIGPAGGWSDRARAQADLLVSFGRITLPHELARLVLTEQVYRALTILAGHPYHSGH